MAVYFLHDGFGHVKIGHATDVRSRQRSLQTGSSSELVLLRVLDGAQPTEAWLHRQFAECRLKGEWFRFDDRMLTIQPPSEEQRRTEKNATPRMSLEEILIAQKLAPIANEDDRPQLLAFQLAGALSNEDSRAFLQWIRQRVAVRSVGDGDRLRNKFPKAA